MPRYFLHLRYGRGRDGLDVDEEGDEVPQPTLRAHVEATARDLMRRPRLGAIRDWRHCTFEVKDDTGQLVLTVPFSQLLNGR